MELKTIKFYNEKGNVASKVRESVKAQGFAKILATLQDTFENAEKNARGGISVPLAITEKGETIYMNLELTVSTKNPAEKVEKKAKAKKADDTDTPPISLFD